MLAGESKDTLSCDVFENLASVRRGSTGARSEQQGRRGRAPHAHRWPPQSSPWRAPAAARPTPVATFAPERVSREPRRGLLVDVVVLEVEVLEGLRRDGVAPALVVVGVAGRRPRPEGLQRVIQIVAVARTTATLPPPVGSVGGLRRRLRLRLRLRSVAKAARPADVADARQGRVAP